MTLPTYSVEQAVYQLTNGYWGGARHSFTLGAARTITYSVAANLSASEIVLIEQALETWSAVANIHFQQVSAGNIRFQNTGAGAYTNSSMIGSSLVSSTVNVSAAWIASYGNTLGSYGFQTYIHEIGHALGLGHTGNYNGTARFSRDALYANDSWQTSVMSYFSQSENTYSSASYARVLTPMAFDIAAIRALYGAAAVVHGGDTTYGHGSTAGDALDLLGRTSFDTAVTFTLVDTSGTDLLDFSTRSEANRIDLTAGAVSDVFGRRGNMIIYAETVIENLRTGAGADTLTGNAVGNVISSGAGDDLIDGGAGDDRLAGGTGNDRITAGAGLDVLRGGAGNDTLAGGAGNDLLIGGTGADRFVFVASDGRDRIVDFHDGQDRIDLSALPGLASWADLSGHLRQSGGAVLIELAGLVITLEATQLGVLNGADFLF